jgi:Flp pilus assembly protein TadB
MLRGQRQDAASAGRSYAGAVPHRDEVHRITSADPDPPQELVSRERTYLILMGIRMVAIVVAVVVPGVWRAVAIALGVFLPYFAVVLVNQARTRGTALDPYAFVPEHKVALADRPFEGTIIRPED